MVLGIGCTLYSDEGFGVRVVEKMQREYEFADNVLLVDGGVLGINLLGVISKPNHLIVVDAVRKKRRIVGAFGSLLAFWKRLRTGRGQHVDVAAMDATAGLSDWSLANYSLNPNLGHRAGTGIYTLYRCADGFIRMIILVPKHWRALKDWVGNPEELEDPKYDQFINRLVELDKIVAVLERFFADKKKVDVAVYEITKSVVEGNFQPGEVRYDLAADGVGYSTSGGFVDDIVDQLEAAREAIVSGEVEVPTAP